MISIIIPYRDPIYPDRDIRKKNFEYVQKHFKKFLPTAEIIIGDQNNEEKDFCRSNAINNGVKESSGDILILSDADVLLTKTSLKNTIKLLPKHDFILPFGYVVKMNPDTSATLLWNDHLNFREMEEDALEIINIRPGESSYGDKLAGGMQLITRELFDRVNGYDERFKGWGYEDTAFCWKIQKELGDYPILNDDKLYHLWHPRDNQLNWDNYNLAQKLKLQWRIKDARNDRLSCE